MPPIHRPESWLARIFLKAKELRWCVRPSCTTCACTKFRTAYLAEARRRAGFPVSAHGDVRVERLGDVLEGLGEEGRAATYETLISAVRELPREATHGDAFRVVSIDLSPPLMRWGIADSLSSRWEGTPAGDALSKMERHSQALAEARRRRDEFDSPEATAERRAEAARQEAQRDEARRREQQNRNQRRLELLQKLTAMSPTERLEWLAAQPPSFPLDSIPAELIADGLEHEPISASLARNLVERIGGRRGAWARIRSQLENS